MKLSLFLLLTINIVCSQTLSVVPFIKGSSDYFKSEVYDNSITLPYTEEQLEDLYERVENGNFKDYSKDKRIYVNHFLFRYFLELDHPKAIDAGIRSFKLIKSLKNPTNEYKYIKGFYQYHVSEMGAWKKKGYLFSNTYGDKDKGIQNILTEIPESSILYCASNYDQFNLNIKESSNFLVAKTHLERLIKKNPTSEKLLKTYMKLVFETGFFEDAVQTLSPLVHRSHTSSERFRMLSYIAQCYYYMGETVVSEQYFYQSNTSDSIADKSLNMLNIAKLTYLNTPNDSLKIHELEKWLDDEASNNEYDKWIEFKERHNSIDMRELKQAELYLNCKDKTKARKLLNSFYSSEYRRSDRFNRKFMLLYAKLLWNDEDYFNAKRYLHNLKNSSDDITSKVNNMIHLILADIAFRSNDFNQSEEYLSNVDIDKLPFYEHHKYFYLNHFLNNQ